MNVSARLLVVCTVTILVFMQAAGQEPARIDYPPNLPEGITVSDLRAIDQTTGVVKIKNNGSRPAKLDLVGIAFISKGSGGGGMQGVIKQDTGGGGSGGVQGVMTSGLRVASSVSPEFLPIEPSPVKPVDASGKLGLWEGLFGLGIAQASATAPPEAGTAPTMPQPSGSVIELAPGETVELVVEFLCFEPERPDPAPGATWQMAGKLAERNSAELAQKQRILRQLVRGLDAVDAEIAQLAKSVHESDTDKTAIEYRGEPLSETAAHLLYTTDWSVQRDGSVHGVLNRALVAQFAFWVLTDHYTQRDLTRKLREARFASVQPREASIRWSIRYLLERAGFDPNLFDPSP